MGFPYSSVGKESACNAGDSDLIPESGRSPGEENGNPLSVLAWRIPWTEEPDSPWARRVGHDLATKPKNGTVNTELKYKHNTLQYLQS